MKANDDIRKNENQLLENIKTMNNFFTDNSSLAELKKAYNTYKNNWDAKAHSATKYDIVLNNNGNNIDDSENKNKPTILQIYKLFLKNAR